MTRNLLFSALGAFCVVCLFVGYQLYQQHNTSSVEINIGKSGLSVQSK